MIPTVHLDDCGEPPAYVPGEIVAYYIGDSRYPWVFVALAEVIHFRAFWRPSDSYRIF